MLKLILLITGLSVASCRNLHFYRHDYQYFEQHDAYYKLHHPQRPGDGYENAVVQCYKEGSRLFYPTNDEEKLVMKDLTTDPEVLVGIHDETGLDNFIAVDGKLINVNASTNNEIEYPICATVESEEVSTGPPCSIPYPVKHKSCVVMNETGVLRAAACDINVPFICKKSVKVENSPCPTIDTAYVYKRETNKCYKVHNSTMSWKQALLTCAMEGGMLAIVETSQEAGIIPDLFRYSSNRPQYNKIYFAGFRRFTGYGEYYTLKAQKLDDIYNERYNNGYGQTELTDDCGSLYVIPDNNIMYIRTSPCQELLPFICQIEV